MAVAVLQITDLHVCAGASAVNRHGVCTLRSLREVVGAVRERFDVLAITGDLSGDDTPASYARVAEEVRRMGPAPVVVTPGNHDVVAHADMRDVAANEGWTAAPAGGFAILDPYATAASSQRGPWRVLLVDTAKHSAEGKSIAGRVSAQTCSAIHEALSQPDHRDDPDRRFLVLMHHPPAPPGGAESVWRANCLEDARAFLESLPPPPPGATHAVRYVILHGHTHSVYARVGEAGGLPAHVAQRSCPSTCHQYLEDAPEFTGDPAALPGYQHVVLHGDGRCVGHVRRLAELSAAGQTGLAHPDADADALDANSIQAAFAKAAAAVASDPPNADADADADGRRSPGAWAV